MSVEQPRIDFMHVVPHYEVRWSDGFALTVAIDDLQAVIRSVIRSYPTRKISLQPIALVDNQIVSPE